MTRVLAVWSRIPANRNPWETLGTRVAEVLESPLAKRVTRCPCLTNSSVSQETTLSVPPYSLGGTASANGATCAIRILYPFLISGREDGPACARSSPFASPRGTLCYD